MALSNFQRTIVDDAGNVIPNATVTVRVNDSSGALASLFTDRAGTTPASNPISADGEGFVRFYVAGGRYYIKAEGASSEIEWEDYLIGTMQGQDSDDVDITGGDIAGADITGGTINNTPIGGTTANTGAFTTASASTSVTTPLITRAGNIELSATGANLLDFKTNGQDRMRIDSSGNVAIGTTAPLAILDTGSSFRQRSANTARHSYLKFVKSVQSTGTGANTALSITVPHSSVDGSFIVVEAIFASSRAAVLTGNGNLPRQSKVSKAYFAIARNSGNANVVLNSNLASQNWDATTSNAGGSVEPNAISPTISRAGSEPNTDPQEVIITVVAGQVAGGPNVTGVLCSFDVYIASAIGLSNFTIV